MRARILSRKQRLLIALGGLILFIGFTMLGLAILGAFNVFRIEVLLQRFNLLVGTSIALGALDVIIGLLLWFQPAPVRRNAVEATIVEEATRIRKARVTRGLTIPSRINDTELRGRVTPRIARGLFFLGYLEVGIGFALMVAALFSYFNVIDMQALIALPSDYFPLFIFVILMFGFVFAASGFFVIDKARRGV